MTPVMSMTAGIHMPPVRKTTIWKKCFYRYTLHTNIQYTYCRSQQCTHSQKITSAGIRTLAHYMQPQPHLITHICTTQAMCSHTNTAHTFSLVTSRLVFGLQKCSNTTLKHNLFPASPSHATQPMKTSLILPRTSSWLKPFILFGGNFCELLRKF